MLVKSNLINLFNNIDNWRLCLVTPILKLLMMAHAYNVNRFTETIIRE